MQSKRTNELLGWLLQQDLDVMSHLFAFCVATTVDGISPVGRAHAISEVANTLNWSSRATGNRHAQGISRTS